MSKRRYLVLWMGALALPPGVRAQEQPLTASATVYTGFYSTSSRGDVNQSLKFVPFGAQFDFDGYLLTPDLLTFSVVPQLSLGPQASEAGIQGGNGVRLRVTLLRRRAFPLTFRYSNVQVEDVYFGSLSQISGYRLQNRNKDLGLTWEFHPTTTASLVADWGTGSVDSKSDVAQIPDYISHQNHVNVDGQYEKAGWDFQAFFHHQHQESNLLTAIDGSSAPAMLTQDVTQYQGSARKTLFRDSEFYVDGGTQSTSSLLFTLPIDLTNHYGNMNLRLFQRRRWKSSFRVGYSSNLASQLLAQADSSLTGPGAVASTTILTPFSYGISNLNFAGTTTAELAYGFGLYGTVERNEVLAADQGGPLNSNYLTATAGVNYAKKFHWGNVNAQYGRELGSGSITGQSGTITGETYRASFEHGTSNGNVFEVDVHGSDQNVKNAQPLSNRSFSADASVSLRITPDWGTSFGGGWQHSSFINDANEFRTNGYTARIGVENPRYQVNASYSNSLSDSLPFYSQFFNLGVGSILLNPLQVIPSDYRALSFGAHANPMRKMEVSGTWTHSRQHLAGVLNNDFELINFYATYHFRRLQLESGYIRFNQLFASYPTVIRSRFYVRVQRTARIL